MPNFFKTLIAAKLGVRIFIFIEIENGISILMPIVRRELGKDVNWTSTGAGVRVIVRAIFSASGHSLPVLDDLSLFEFPLNL